MAGKTLEEKIAQGRQYRSMMMNIRKDDKEPDKDTYIVEGYASTFNAPYTLYEDESLRFNEQVDSRAFDDCDMSDVILQYDHQGKVYARGSNGTLEIKADEHGLFIRANLGGTEDGRKLYEEIKGGYTTKMSFGFTVDTDEETRSQDETTGKAVYLRTITKIGRLYDVSAVSLPANDGTEISARNLVDGVISRQAQELSEKEKAIAEEEKHKKAKQERERLALELSFSL